MTGLETAGAIASLITTAATVVTLGVLVWYTLETQKLRREAQRQNETNTMPIVMFQSALIELHNGQRSKLIIRNLGSGPAFNIVMEPMAVGICEASFLHVKTLAANQDEPVKVAGLIHDGPQSDVVKIDSTISETHFFIRCLRGICETGVTHGVIRYVSATGKRYCTRYSLDHESTDADSLVIFDGMEAE